MTVDEQIANLKSQGKTESTSKSLAKLVKARGGSGGSTTVYGKTGLSNPVDSSGSNSDLIQNAIDMNNRAIDPAVSSYKESIPEIQSGFSSQRDTLSQKYDNLLSSIKGNQTTAENRQTVTTQNELGRRGILTDTGLGQQEMTNALNPITSEYTGLLTDTGLSKIGDINQSYTDETSALRSVYNAIAQLQAGAGQTGVAQGLTAQQNATNMSYQQARDKVADALSQSKLSLSQQQLSSETENNNAVKALQQQVIDLINGNNSGTDTSSSSTQSIEDAASSFMGIPQLSNNGLTGVLPSTIDWNSLGIKLPTVK